LNLFSFNAELDTNASYTSKLFLLASKAVIELELSTTIAKLGLMISKVFLVIMGSTRMIPNNDRKRNKAKKQIQL
jgi:hypothetical protein